MPANESAKPRDNDLSAVDKSARAVTAQPPSGSGEHDGSGSGIYLSAREAIELLDIKPQTLYAYVTRGWVRAVGQPGSRQKRYLRDDIEKLRARSQARAGHGPTAAGALRWGEPVIASSITEITPDGPRYRGILATDMVRRECAYEATANLLWSGVWDETASYWPRRLPGAAFEKSVNRYMRHAADGIIHSKFATIVQVLSEDQGGNPEILLGSSTVAGCQIIHTLAGAFGLLCRGGFVAGDDAEPVAHIVLRALGREADDAVINAVNAALVLAADHELALPTFAARAVASTGAPLNACVLTGLVSFDGPLTGIVGRGLEEFAMESRSQADLRRKIETACRQGRQLVGFNHPLYPTGDPRALQLMDLVKALPVMPAPAHALLETLEDVTRDGNLALGFPAGLLLLQMAFGLPPRTGGALFLLGRIAGLVAHVQEQRLAGFFMRPRAKYIA